MRMARRESRTILSRLFNDSRIWLGCLQRSRLLQRASARASPEVRVSPDDRSQPAKTKKRLVLGSLGFFERTYNFIGTTVTITGYAGLAEP
jgi:hypothetical protein